jgi:hypothetical protein
MREEDLSARRRGSRLEFLPEPIVFLQSEMSALSHAVRNPPNPFLRRSSGRATTRTGEFIKFQFGIPRCLW